MPQFRFYSGWSGGYHPIDLILADGAAAIACGEQLIVGEEIQFCQSPSPLGSPCALGTFGSLGERGETAHQIATFVEVAAST